MAPLGGHHPVTPVNPDDPNWFDMNQFVKSGASIGLPIKRTLANLDPDTQPAVSPSEVTDEEWRLVVRGYGLVILTPHGIRLACRETVGSAQLGTWGLPLL